MMRYRVDVSILNENDDREREWLAERTFHAEEDISTAEPAERWASKETQEDGHIRRIVLMTEAVISYAITGEHNR